MVIGEKVEVCMCIMDLSLKVDGGVSLEMNGEWLLFVVELVRELFILF